MANLQRAAELQYGEYSELEASSRVDAEVGCVGLVMMQLRRKPRSREARLGTQIP